MTTLASSVTIGEAQDWLRTRLDDGDTCPVCTQHAQVYRWSLYGTAIQALSLLFRLGGTTVYIHTRQLKDHGYKGQGDASRLAHWGLVEEETARREDGGRSGFWRVTDRGRRYLFGQEAVPKYAYVYDGRVLRFDGPSVHVTDSVGKRFSYDDLMRGLM